MCVCVVSGYSWHRAAADVRGNLEPRETLSDVLQSIMGKFAVIELEWTSMTQWSVLSWHKHKHTHTYTQTQTAFFSYSFDFLGHIFCVIIRFTLTEAKKRKLCWKKNCLSCKALTDFTFKINSRRPVVPFLPFPFLQCLLYRRLLCMRSFKDSKILKVKTLKVSVPTDAPLSHRNHCSRNASSVVMPFNSVTLWHHITSQSYTFA